MLTPEDGLPSQGSVPLPPALDGNHMEHLIWENTDGTCELWTVAGGTTKGFAMTLKLLSSIWNFNVSSSSSSEDYWLQRKDEANEGRIQEG